MKKGIITMGLAGAVLMAQAMPAQAINKEWSAVAGFVGGMLFANAANNNNNSHYSSRNRPGAVAHRQYVQQVQCQPVQQVVYRQPVRQTVVYEEPVQTGYWAWRTKRVYVPGRWVYEDTGCGTQRKVWYAAHYKTSRYKVWVDTSGWSDW